MPEVIHEFWAVTLNPISIFKISDTRDANGCPIVECWAARSNGTTPPGLRLKNGHAVALTRQGIILYDIPIANLAYNGPLKPPPIEEVGMSYRSGRTNDVVGLFDNLNEAFVCFHEINLKCLDPRWKEPTVRVLSRIGDSHPTFVPSPFPVYAFIYNNPLD